MGLDVEVPPKVEMAAPPPQTDQKQLVITIKADGVYLNTQKMSSLKELRDMVARQMVSRPAAERVVFINSEDNLQFERAVQAMDAAHEAGAQKVGFLTDAPKR
jgi:biopolymer transport protein ExbD